MWIKFKFWIMRVLAWLALRAKLYYVWSSIYQFLWERSEIKNMDLFIPGSIKELEKVVGEMVWRKDTWIMLGDAISHPKATYSRHIFGKKAGDCDDISLFAIDRLAAMPMTTTSDGDRSISIALVYLLSIPWIKNEDNKIGGHNVGVLKYYDGGSFQFAYISNWFNGTIRWGFKNIKDIVRHVLQRVDATSIGWGLAEWRKDKLRLVRYENGKDL